jgi:hypothetical protein
MPRPKVKNDGNVNVLVSKLGARRTPLDEAQKGDHGISRRLGGPLRARFCSPACATPSMYNARRS